MLWTMLMAAALTDEAFTRAVKHSPPDLRRVIERRLGCNHWGGEEPYDAERATQINQAVRSLQCRTLERDEARLRARYARQPARLRLLRAAADRTG